MLSLCFVLMPLSACASCPAVANMSSAALRRISFFDNPKQQGRDNNDISTKVHPLETIPSSAQRSAKTMGGIRKSSVKKEATPPTSKSMLYAAAHSSEHGADDEDGHSKRNDLL